MPAERRRECRCGSPEVAPCSGSSSSSATCSRVVRECHLSSTIAERSLNRATFEFGKRRLTHCRYSRWNCFRSIGRANDRSIASCCRHSQRPRQRVLSPSEPPGPPRPQSRASEAPLSHCGTTVGVLYSARLGSGLRSLRSRAGSGPDGPPAKWVCPVALARRDDATEIRNARRTRRHADAGGAWAIVKRMERLRARPQVMSRWLSTILGRDGRMPYRQPYPLAQSSV